MNPSPAIQTIVVGTDFSEPAEQAVKVALQLARHTGAALHLVNAGIVPDFGREASRFFSAEELEELARESFRERREMLAEMRQRFSGQGVEVSHEVIQGSPDTALCEAAAGLGADLVVVGSHGRTGLAHFLLGSVAERVVRVCERRVLVARAGEQAEGGFRRILVATDLREQAERALESAMLLAARGAEIEILHLWQMPPGASVHYGTPPSAPLDLRRLRDQLQAQAEEQGKALLERHEGSGLSLRFRTFESPAAQGILDRADHGDFGLVAVGSHGRRGFRRWILGSVAEMVVRHARTSVLVTP